MEKPRRSSLGRLLVLLGIALVGYEIVVYRHWIDGVPLRPNRVLSLTSDQYPLGFVGQSTFAIAKRFQSTDRRYSSQGPVQLHEFGGPVTERLRPGDLVSGHLPLQWEFPHRNDHWSPFAPVVHVVAQHTVDSAARIPAYYFLDERRILEMIEGVLQCHDLETGRTIWSRSDVQSVQMIKGRFADVMMDDGRPRRWSGIFGVPYYYYISMPTLSPTPSPARALLDLDNGQIASTFKPDAFFSVVDVSPDSKWIAYRSKDALEVWSVDEGKMAWRKPYFDFGKPGYQFTADGESLLKFVVDRSRTLLFSRIRTVDGHQEDGISEAPATSASSLLGRRYALFQKRTEKQPDLLARLWTEAQRWGLISATGPRQVDSYLFNVDTGQLAGIVSASDSNLYSADEGDAFAIQRPRQGGSVVELYTLPPQPDWTWWILRAVVLPLAVIPLVLLMHGREAARARREQSSTHR